MLDRLQWSANALGDTTRLAYDAFLLDTLTDARGKQHVAVYNTLGQVTQTMDPEGETTTIGYDENGNVVSVTDRIGRQASFGYDALNLPTFEQIEGDTTYLWVDPDGLKSAARNAVSVDTTVFDGAGRPVKQIVRRGAGFTRRYVIDTWYEDDGPPSRIFILTPGPVNYDIDFTWDDEGRFTRLSDLTPVTDVHTGPRLQRSEPTRHGARGRAPALGFTTTRSSIRWVMRWGSGSAWTRCGCA